MALNISPVIFNTGPDDSLAAVDVYTNAPATPINTDTAVIPGVSGFADSVLKKLAGVHIPLTGDLGLLVQSVQSGDYITSLNQVAKLVGNVQGGIQNLKKDVINGLLGAVGATPAMLSAVQGLSSVQGRQSALTGILDQVPQARMLMGTIDTIRNIKDVDSADGYVKLVSAITGNPDISMVVDMGAQAAVAGAVASGLTAQKLSNLIGPLGAPFAANPELNDQYMTDVANSAAINCDMTGLNIALGSQNTPDFDPPVPGLSSNASLCVSNPMIINDVVNNYLSAGNDVDSDGFPITKSTESAQLIETLTKINPDWQTSDRNGVQVSDLNVFQGCTPDAQTLFEQNETTAQTMLVANSYPPANTKDLLAQNFPMTQGLDFVA